MGYQEWLKMESQATQMTNERNKKLREIKEKLARITSQGGKHQSIVLKATEPETTEIVTQTQESEDPITYNTAYYVLSYLTPDGPKRKKGNIKSSD